MSGKSLQCWVVSALLCSTLAVRSQELPEGKGKDIVANLCSTCHTFAARVGGGYTAQGWATVLRMMSNQGLALTADQRATLSEYLVKNFPERPRPAAVLLAGPTQVSIKAWQVPSPGSRPHDPLATADGALWYTGQMANVLGRLDPKTGQFREFALKTAHSGPHGLVEDRLGNIWYTGNTGALIGRLDPRTGEIKLLTPPTPNSRPYGMAVNSKGRVFYVAFGTHKVGSVDPKTLAVREYTLPDPAGGDIVRNTSVTPDGGFVLANSLTNEVSLVSISK